MGDYSPPGSLTPASWLAQAQAYADSLIADLSDGTTTLLAPDFTAPTKNGVPILNQVEIAASYVSRTGGSTILPAVNAYGLKIVSAANLTGGASLRLSDRVADGGGGPANQFNLLEVAHEGSANAVNIYNYAGSGGIPLAVHQYENANANSVVQFDQTADNGGGAILNLANAQNANVNPGHHGQSDFIRMTGYYAYNVTRAVGVVTGGNTLEDTTTPAAWVPEDVGKPITVGAVTTTILNVVSPTKVTTVSNALVNGAGVTYSYASDKQLMLRWAKNHVITNSGTTPVQFQTNLGTVVALSVAQPNGATAAALKVSQPGAANSIDIEHTGASTALQVNAFSASVGSSYAAAFSGYKYAVTMSNQVDSGTATPMLSITKNGAGTQPVAQIVNKGTGKTLDVTDGANSVFQIGSGGHPYMRKSAAAPAVDATGGKLYVDAAGNLHYLGAAGTDTQLAAA